MTRSERFYALAPAFAQVLEMDIAVFGLPDGATAEPAFVIAELNVAQLETVAARLLELIAEVAEPGADTCPCCARSVEQARTALKALNAGAPEPGRRPH